LNNIESSKAFAYSLNTGKAKKVAYWRRS